MTLILPIVAEINFQQVVDLSRPCELFQCHFNFTILECREISWEQHEMHKSSASFVWPWGKLEACCDQLRAWAIRKLDTRSVWISGNEPTCVSIWRNLKYLDSDYLAGALHEIQRGKVGPPGWSMIVLHHGLEGWCPVKEIFLFEAWVTSLMAKIANLHKK